MAPSRYGLYVITDRRLSRGLSHGEVARRVVQGGADVVQLRDKDLSDRELYCAAVEMRSVTRDTGTLFIVNDRMDVALASHADGVHLGQDDLPLEAARRLAPKGFIMGVSVSSAEEAMVAQADGADYVALGPIFSTATKSDAGPAVGLQRLREVRAAVEIPLIGIGGITLDNVQDVVAAGADGAAVVSAAVGQEDIASSVRRLKERMALAKRQC
ncbi:MAG: thiamine phosphate synthase [Methanomassiliicoccaceae archaeon]|nr:thiamine phosphate synthase [Euryarchaeota archaeon]HOB39310.1 thiamine phosphate synthase [Methanomassiliicoccaceae archaeon]HPP44734.1 thiamine phosphate synthase [Methanomassiliicoccaceae archaeon]HQA21813.1 thiamine phosphate synthase [Methanomassiliicoccaceae archaeon]HQD88564.1 thiamine phosphate synthase [Methanomassiliicoccaceae archaeon]